MGEATIELLFWIIVFVGLFFLFRWLQARKKARQDKEDGH